MTKQIFFRIPFSEHHGIWTNNSNYLIQMIAFICSTKETKFSKKEIIIYNPNSDYFLYIYIYIWQWVHAFIYIYMNSKVISVIIENLRWENAE